MIRVTTVQPVGSPVMLRVEGSLREADLAELSRAVRLAADDRRALVLDLAGVSFMDRAGAEWTRRMHADGIALTGTSGLIGELLGLPQAPGGSP